MLCAGRGGVCDVCGRGGFWCCVRVVEGFVVCAGSRMLVLWVLWAGGCAEGREGRRAGGQVALSVCLHVNSLLH